MIDKLSATDCKNIEKCFEKLKTTPSDTNSLRNIENVIGRSLQKDVEVKISRGSSQNQTDQKGSFIMCVYPDDDTTTRIVNAIMNNKTDDLIASTWESCKKWTIEIDANILTDSRLNFTPRELTALILHEVQHMIYSTSTRKRLCDTLKMVLVKNSIDMKNVFKNSMFSPLIKPVWFSLLCMNLSNNPKELKKELDADKFAKKMGYGQDLLNVIKKILEVSKQDNSYSAVFKNQYNESDAIISYTEDTLKQLKKRESALARKQYGQLSSPVDKIQESLDYNMERIFMDPVSNRTVHGRSFYERVYSLLDKIEYDTYNSDYFLEGFSIKKLKKIDPYDLGYIDLQIDAARTNEDRILILSFLHSKLDLVEYYITLSEKGDRRYVVPHSKESLYKMRDRLLDSEKRLIAKNTNVNPTSAIVINYPKGYEG